MATCDKCGSKDLVQIDLSPAGRPVKFATCRDCENRWWSDAENAGNLRLREVLDLVAAA